MIVEKTGRAGEAIEVPVPNAELWSPDRPQLHDLQIELIGRRQGGGYASTATSACGRSKSRKMPTGINRLWLNNKVLFQYGPLDQGWWPDGLYTPPTDEAHEVRHRDDQEAGHEHGPQAREVRDRRGGTTGAIKLGLLVWQDMPSGDAGKSAESKANYRRELQAMIDALANHPSIVMWVPFNEGWGQHDTAEVVAWIEKYDPTRPVNEASGWHDRGSGDCIGHAQLSGAGDAQAGGESRRRAGRVWRARACRCRATPGRRKRIGDTFRTTMPTS